MPDYKDVKISDPITAFGDVEVAESSPIIQLDAVQGLKTQEEVEVFTGTGGTLTVEDTGTGFEWRAQTGTSVGGYALVRSQKAVNYRAGQGTVYRFAGRFDAGIPLSSMRIGCVTVGNELTFGYNGEDFGILVRNSGKLEIVVLTISAAASGAETATITLDDVEYTASLTNVTASQNAVEIAAADYSSNWQVVSNSNTVTFIAQSVGLKAGSYAFSSTGTAAGTMAVTTAGAAVNDNWYLQTQWNRYRCDGSGAFAFTLNPQKGNVYQVKQQYLGYGAIKFYIQNPADGCFMLVHEVQYANANDSPSLTDPSYKVGVFGVSLGSTTNLNAYMSSCYGAIQGKDVALKNPNAHANWLAATTTLTNVLSIRPRLDINGIINLKQIQPHLVSIAADGSKPVIFHLMINPTIAGFPIWEYHENNTTDDLVEIMDAAVAITVNNSVTIEIGDYVLGRTGNEVIDLTDLNIYLKRGDVLTLACETTSGNSDVAGSIVWKEL